MHLLTSLRVRAVVLCLALMLYAFTLDQAAYVTNDDPTTITPTPTVVVPNGDGGGGHTGG